MSSCSYEQRPRAQSRATATLIPHGHGLVFTTRDRPVQSARGWSAAPVRHGVSVIRSGQRFTLGLVFHDASLMPYTLLGADGLPYQSETPRAVRRAPHQTKIYGRLDCPTALRAIAVGGYVASRVFFADEPTAVAAGYRPCAICMPAAHKAWKAR